MEKYHGYKEERIRGPLYDHLLSLMLSLEDEETSRKASDIVSAGYGESISYRKLPEYLSVLSLTVREMYAGIGVSVEFPSPEFEEVCLLCEEMPIEIRSRIHEVLYRMVPSWHEEVMRNFPSVRLYKLFQRTRLGRSDRLSESEAGVVERKGVYNASPHIRPEKFPELSVQYGVSLRWVLGGDRRLIVYGSAPETDDVLELFSFLQPSQRDNFLQLLRELHGKYAVGKEDAHWNKEHL